MSPQQRELRAWRRTKDLVRVAVANLDDPQKSCAGWVVDHSRGGVCVAFDPQTLSLDVREPLLVQPMCTDEAVEVRVKNFRKNAGQVQIGCELARPGENKHFSMASGNWLEQDSR